MKLPNSVLIFALTLLPAAAPVAAAPLATPNPLQWTNPIAHNRADPHVFLLGRSRTPELVQFPANTIPLS